MGEIMKRLLVLLVLTCISLTKLMAQNNLFENMPSKTKLIGNYPNPF